MPGLFTELKQRRVFRVLAAYLIAAWVAIEVSSTVAPLLDLPEWVPRLVLVLLAAGFPPAMILAWFFDFTPESGFRRAPAAPSSDREGRLRTWGLGALATAVFALVGFGLGLRWNATPEGDRVSRVVVSVFENRTGDEALDPLGHMASDWVTQGLTEAGFIEVADPQTAFTAFRQAQVATGGVAPEILAREARATLVVRGSYYQSGDSLLINAEVRDVVRGRVVTALPALTAAADDPLAAVETLRQRVVTALALQVDSTLEDFGVAPARPPAYEAYQAYVEGLQAYLEGRYVDAATAFDRAIARDSAFDAAVLWAAHSHWFTGNAADSLSARLALLEPRRDRLSSYDRGRMDWIRHFRDGDFDALYRSARQVAMAAPGSVNAKRELALAAMRTWRYQEALEIFRDLFPPVGLMRSWSEAYPYHIELLHLTGRHDEEAELVRAGQRNGQLDRADALRLRAVAAAGVGDVATATRLADSASTGDGVIELIVGRELVGHGRERAGRALIDQAVPMLEAVTADPWIPVVLGQAYYAQGRYDTARSTLERASPFWWAQHRTRLAFLIRIATRQGDTAAVDRYTRDAAARFWWDAELVTARGTAAAAALRGNRDRAVDLLREGHEIADGEPFRLHVTADPDFASLKGHPPFERLIEGRR